MSTSSSNSGRRGERSTWRYVKRRKRYTQHLPAAEKYGGAAAQQRSGAAAQRRSGAAAQRQKKWRKAMAGTGHEQ